jgi:hypothetical protein
VAERINLDVAASLSSLSTIRRVLGGLGARLGFSLDDIDDLYLSTEEVIRCALGYETPERLRLEMLVSDEGLRIEIGGFFSSGLRGELRCETAAQDVVDLACLLRNTVDEVCVEDQGGGAFAVALVRRHRRVP